MYFLFQSFAVGLQVLHPEYACGAFGRLLACNKALLHHFATAFNLSLEAVTLKQVDGIACTHAYDVGDAVIIGDGFLFQQVLVGGHAYDSPERGGFAIGGPLAFALEPKVGEHCLCGKEVAVEYGGPALSFFINSTADVQAEVVCHDALCDVVEHPAAHRAARGGKSCFLKADDATVSWLVGREVTDETHEVVQSSCLVSNLLLGYLRSAGLSCDGKGLRLGFLARSFLHHLEKHVLYFCQRGWFADLLSEHHGRQFGGHAVLDFHLHEPGLHHLSVVGDGVVECQGGDGWHLGLIADAHPRQRGAAPERNSLGVLLVWITDAWNGVSDDGQFQVFCYAHPVESVDEFLWLLLVEFVDDLADADVGTHLERFAERYGAVTSRSPVVVVHLGAMHRDLSVAGGHHEGGVHHPVVECDHHRCRLEHAAGFQKVGHGMVASLQQLSVHLFQVDDGFHVAGGHLHDDGHSYVGVDFTHLVGHRFFRDVLHLHIDGGDDVLAIDRFHVDELEHLVSHSLVVEYSRGATQDAVKGLLQSETGLVHLSIHVAHGAVGERAERPATRIVLVEVEAAYVFVEVEDRKVLHLLERVVVDAIGPYWPVLAQLGTPFLQVFLEIFHRPFREYFVEAHADAVLFYLPEAVAVLFAHLEVHEHLVFRERTGHQFALVAEDVAAIGVFLVCFVAFFLVCHFHPVVFLDCHDVYRLEHHGHPDDGHQDGDEGVSWHDVVVVELAHGCISWG